MSDPDDLRDLERELDRVVDRLNSLPLARVEGFAPRCWRTADLIVEQTRRLTDDIPAHATVPTLQPHGLGAMLAVLGRDYLEAAGAPPGADVSIVTEALGDLRRALP